VGALEIFDESPGNICWVVLEILVGCPGDIWSVSWRYLKGVLEIFYGCPVDI